MYIKNSEGEIYYMFSVTQRLETISRPQKYISRDLFIEEEYLDNFTPVTIPTEYAAIQGMVVDYMIRKQAPCSVTQRPI